MRQKPMLTLLDTTISSLRKAGATKTLRKIVRYPFRHRLAAARERQSVERVLRLSNAEDIFTDIFTTRAWGDEESASGAGSTIERTEHLRSRLPELFRTFSIQTIFDAPCGDFNWMKYVLEDISLAYIGGDIVAPLIAINKERYGNSNTRFIHIDLTKGTFPASDLMLCRDCLFHLSYRDTRLILERFIESGIPYLLTTTHINTAGEVVNKDIRTGEFRFIDLFSPPYHFPKDVHFRVEDWKAPYAKREMCLWIRAQVIEALKLFPASPSMQS